jgi:hypothetical protein
MTSPSWTRRLSDGALALVIVTLSFVMLAGQASSQTPESFRDDFTSISYSGNNGSMDWSASWQESGESDGPTSGNVQVTASDRCFGGSGNCLRIGSDGGNLANHGVSRAANLANAVSATLSFRYRRQTQGQVPGSVTVQVSGNGGSSWTTLTTINLAGPQKALTATLDISRHTGSNTVVWFRGSGSGVAGYLYIDAVDVTANMGAPSTTTTVVTTTIPGTPTTTTTTVPGTPTTTTIPGTPTTTTPGSPKTTLAGTPTTTGPTSTSPGTPPTTTNTGGHVTTPDVPAEATASAQEAAAQPQQASSTVDGLAPIAIAVETVSANAMTLGILALLASALAIVGIDRSKRQSPPDTDTDTDGESNAESEPPAEK